MLPLRAALARGRGRAAAVKPPTLLGRKAGGGCVRRITGSALRRGLTRRLSTSADGATSSVSTPSRRNRALLGGVAAGLGGYGAWYLGVGVTQPLSEEEEIDLPAVAEPIGHFRHPYEDWPWYRKAWFAVRRSVFLAWVFAPFFCASTCLVLFQKDKRESGPWRDYWLEQMLQCTQRAGAAFQKFGQWLSMRPDMFPPDVIQVLSKLRSDAPSHPVEVSRRSVRTQLGHEVDELFDSFSDEPVASGSVGQVHRAHLRAEFALDGPGGRLRDVAVKVQHPGVVDSAFMDLSIVWKVVEFSQQFLHMTVPFNRGEFDEVIRAQMDFTREAFNLQRFSQNFRAERGNIRFPKVSPKFVTPQILVETWAEGEVISKILEDFDNAKASVNGAASALAQRKRELQGRLCSILYDMSMKMMVRDNFVHGDLHGGNILYSESDKYVTVLDAGIATSLDSKTVAPFGKFLHALCSGNTDLLVEYLQRFNESSAKVDIVELKTDIQAIMDKFMGPLRQHPELPTNAADMFGEVMFSLQKHSMLLKGDVASTLFTISISEGLIRQLDPSFDVAKRAIPYIVRHMALAESNGS